MYDAGLDGHVHAVLGPQTAGNHVELQRADDADDRFATAARDVEHLQQPFLFELPEALVELLVARVLEAGTPEVFRRKTRHVEKPQRLAGMERVADRELSRVDEAENVAGVGDADGLAIAAEEAVGARRPQRLRHPAVEDHHVLLEPAGADADERDAIPMAGIHVRLDLEHEAR